MGYYSNLRKCYRVKLFLYMFSAIWNPFLFFNIYLYFVLIFQYSVLMVKLNCIHQKAFLMNLNHETYNIIQQFI